MDQIQSSWFEEMGKQFPFAVALIVVVWIFVKLISSELQALRTTIDRLAEKIVDALTKRD